MTESTDTRNRRAVLRFYRRARRVRTPYDAMTMTRDHFAYLTATDVLVGSMITARQDALAFDTAAHYLLSIMTREDALPFWYSGKISKPIPPEVIDRCAVCAARDDEHDNALHLHAFRSSL